MEEHYIYIYIYIGALLSKFTFEICTEVPLQSYMPDHRMPRSFSFGASGTLRNIITIGKLKI